jgi:oligopeptidase B
VRDYATHTPKRLSFPEASYSASLDDNPEYDVTVLRIGYESMVTPDTIFDYAYRDEAVRAAQGAGNPQRL